MNFNDEEERFVLEAAGRQPPLAWGRDRLVEAAERVLGRKLAAPKRK